MMCFDVVSEYDNIKRRTVQNRIEFTENEQKLVFRQPNPVLIVHPMPLDQFEHVCCAKLLSVYLLRGPQLLSLPMRYQNCVDFLLHSNSDEC